MSSEEFEKLHEIYKSLYDELKLMPDRAARCHGGTISSYYRNEVCGGYCDYNDGTLVNFIIVVIIA